MQTHFGQGSKSLASSMLVACIWYSSLNIRNRKRFLRSFSAGFPSQKGRHRLHHHPNWAEAVCEQVPLVPYVFYPDKPVHVQVSVNHVNFSDPSYVHEAAVAWVEDLRENNFTVCVTQAGRNEKKNGKTFAMVDWLAYQGAPDGGVSGEMDMPTWWTGTNCRTVSFPPVSWPHPAIMYIYIYIFFPSSIPSRHSISYL